MKTMQTANLRFGCTVTVRKSLEFDPEGGR